MISAPCYVIKERKTGGYRRESLVCMCASFEVVCGASQPRTFIFASLELAFICQVRPSLTVSVRGIKTSRHLAIEPTANSSLSDDVASRVRPTRPHKRAPRTNARSGHQTGDEREVTMTMADSTSTTTIMMTMTTTTTMLPEFVRHSAPCLDCVLLCFVFAWGARPLHVFFPRLSSPLLSLNARRSIRSHLRSSLRATL